ncbi:MAG TPA: NgoFVII family restriction endonuclease [Candidatus Omnitrophota bacterium]|nr:NgoFVII family restriction endonuclease [Candidatus Omnitrophota bacterium]
MELLFSNIPPVRFSKRNTISCFEDLLEDADGIRIASGYISADALAELKKIVEVNKKSFLELVIGMHGFEGFTQSQFDAARYLDEYLRSNKIGVVKVANAFKFHGKVYSFLKKQTAFAGIIGSSNLSSVLDNQNHYEADLIINEAGLVNEIDRFIMQLSRDASVPVEGFKPKIIEGTNTLLDGHEGVEKPSREDLEIVFHDRTQVSFKIPIKGAEDAPHSNLNAFFGKGRENRKGFVKPRHWYEVELIVSSEITSQPGYPKAGYPDKESIITVYTDDGWKFRCKISGDYSKNFRSADDLKILGRWIKGRLENTGALKVGDPVTVETLKRYGRDNFELIATLDPSVWILDFGRVDGNPL